MNELLLADLTPERFNVLASREDDYYFSFNWSPLFYRSQASAGFIAVATQTPAGPVLLPELQKAYAVLDWDDLHIGRSARRLLKGSELTSGRVVLTLNENPAPVLAALEAHWGQESWLIPPYSALLCDLAQNVEAGFRVWGVELRADGKLIAGEVGYATGAVYTSLTGFAPREGPWSRGWGTIQLILLAWELQRRGFAFWNLGQPYMPYKFKLGANLYPRAEFLERWQKAVPGWSLAHGQTPGVTP
ncbi:MAG: GNAT family N-acetyltransferase [Spirochaetales bacterium]|nr:GNAT family N-acetyltransferase [Spirochaetales bacterium]